MDKEILQRYVEGNVSPEEIIAVVDWLDAGIYGVTQIE